MSLRDSLIGRSSVVAVMAISICTVRGVNTNCAARNDVTGNCSPIGVPVALSNCRPRRSRGIAIDVTTRGLQRIQVADIATRTNGVSAMPPMNLLLTPREIRDVVEYLATLR